MRSLVTFRSDSFNTTLEKPEFVNPGNYGDDLARWLMEKLKAEGISAGDAPIQEDYGWVVMLDVQGAPHLMVLGHRPEVDGEGGDWVVWVEKRQGFIGILRGKKGKVPERAMVQALHSILSGAAEVTELRWHRQDDFDRGLEDSWHAEP